MAKKKTAPVEEETSGRSSVSFTVEDKKRLADILAHEKGKRPAAKLSRADILRDIIYEAAKKRGVA